MFTQQDSYQRLKVVETIAFQSSYTTTNKARMMETTREESRAE